MDYIMTKEAAKNSEIPDRILVYLSSAEQIKGAIKTEIHGLFLLMFKYRLTDDIGAVKEGMVKINETDIFG